MCPDVILSTLLHCSTSSSLISIIHVYTMCTPWGILVSWCHFNLVSLSRLFLILLDPKSFQTALDFSRPMSMWLPGHMPISYLSSRCRLIITTTIFICPNPNPRVSPIANRTMTFISYLVVGDLQENSTRSPHFIATLKYNFLVIYATTMKYCAFCPKGLMSYSCLLHSDYARLCILP